MHTVTVSYAKCSVIAGGIKFHLSGSVEARANICRAAPSGVTHVCIVRAWVYFRQCWPTPTTRSDGEADIICIHEHCLHTNKQTHTEAQAYQCLSSSCYWQTIQKQ